MKHLGYTVTPFNPREATDDDLNLTNAFSNTMRAERMPDDPPTPLEEHMVHMRHIPNFVEVHAWHFQAEPGGPLIAAGHVGIVNLETNRHVADFGIDVLPAYRRQGLGKFLLARVAEAARGAGRTLLITGTSGRVPAGAAFLERAGAERGLEMHTNQLDIAKDLNRSLLQSWIDRAEERAADFELVWWNGLYSDEALTVMADMHSAVQNQMPRGDLKMEDTKLTVENMRDMEKGFAAGGGARLTVLAREKETGRYAGFTELHWHPNRPHLLGQGGTGVLTEFRNRGLGRWLKAAALLRALEQHPEAKFVRTGNADSNAAMLSINHAMGFKPYVSNIAWQVETEKALAYANGGAA